MKARWLIAGSLVVIGAGYFVLRGLGADPDPAPTANKRSGKVELGAHTPAAEAPAVERPKMVMTESGMKPVQQHQPREWRDPVSGALNRELVDAVPDPKAAAEQELLYRKRRLRLTLADSAQGCYGGPDSKDEIELEYTLVVHAEEIRADNVRVKSSSLKDPQVERCIIDAVRDMRSLADKVPDMKEEGGLVISLHDLWDRNRRDNQAKDDTKK